MALAYYNEHDPFAAAWLRELIKAGHIAPGEVDERSIEDVVPTDLAGFNQCHFFAGIGVWSYALRLAGWPDNRPVWTGSCPCQPFSAAGKGVGFADERHLWPAFYHLISQCRPDVVFGEQVASKDGLSWLDLVLTDMEATGYACGAVDTCAAGFGAPHIRQRLYWVADAPSSRHNREIGGPEGKARDKTRLCMSGAECRVCGVANVFSTGLEGYAGDGAGSVRQEREVPQPHRPIGADGVSVRLGHPSRGRWKRREAPAPGNEHVGAAPERTQGEHGAGLAGARGLPELGTGPTNGHWRDADWLFCRDGKWRAVEPGSFPLAHGTLARVGRLRGYGNAIVAPQAQAFIEAYLACHPAHKEM
ncbi:DNA cytosine methyltransferase [Desulfovibrio oxamicus]|uniref:DNA cytosine methyltransferase n=1 Tax=Nitratidesulfovibrio oxamicus TaxID=32016 RepID=A0ABS0J0J7_9BACT|nr:DNA cytosine methyltransferase [Nitratidesulfovibrio oxamicus]